MKFSKDQLSARAGRLANRRLVLAAAAAGALGLVAQHANATEFHWTSNTSGNWDTATNWTPNGVPDGGAPFDSAVIDNVAADVNIHLNSLDRTIAGMTFNNTGTTNVVGGSLTTPLASGSRALLRTRGDYTFNAGIGTVNIGDPSVGDPDVPDQNRLRTELTSQYTFTNNSSNPVNFWETVAGPGDDAAPGIEARQLTLEGTGLLGVFHSGISGNSNSTFHVVKNGSGAWEFAAGTTTGGFELNAGSVHAASNNAFGNTTVPTVPEQLAAKRLTINGAGDVTINGVGGSDRTIPAAVPVFVNANFNINTDAVATRRINFAGTIDLGGANRTITVDTLGSEFRGVVSSGGITKAGAGPLIFTNAGNTYAGGTTVNSGGVIVTNTTAVPNYLTGGATLAVGASFGGRLGTDSTLTTTDLDTIKDNALLFDAAGKDFAIDTTTAGSPLATPVSYASVIQDLNGSRGFVKWGNGGLSLGGANTYSGNTTLMGGTLAVTTQGNLGNGSATNNIVVGANATLQTLASLGTVSKTVALLDDARLTVDTNGFDTELSGAISGVGRLTKTGAGTLTVSGNNSYTGRTTVNGAGVLKITHANALGDAVGDTFISGGSTTDVDASLSIDGAGAGGLTIAEPIIMEGKTSGTLTPHVRNVSGNNTITTPIGMDAAGTWFTLQSDAGTLSVAGVNNSTGNATGRDLHLRGAASGEVTGPVQNTTGTGPFSVSKHDAGTWTLSGVNTYTGGTTVNAGTLQVSRMHENNAVNITGGTLRVLESAPGLSSGLPSGDNAAVSRPSSLTIAAGATLDLSNNDLILDYTDELNNPAVAIEDLIASGYNGGDWLGAGITSSIAQQDGNFALAIADNALLTSAYSSFDGQTVDTTTVLVKFTWVDDLDLDGQVTSNDAITFGNNYSPGDPATRATGDMDYDGVFTSNDAILFGNAYDTSLPSVPEPGTLGVLGIMGLSLIRRRARKLPA